MSFKVHLGKYYHSPLTKISQINYFITKLRKESVAESPQKPKLSGISWNCEFFRLIKEKFSGKFMKIHETTQGNKKFIGALTGKSWQETADT